MISRDEIFENWKMYLKVLKERSDKTIINYASYIQKYFNWLDEKSIDYLEITTLKMLNDYYMREVGDKGQSTKNITVSSLKNFYKYLLTQGALTNDPTALLETVKLDKKSRAYLTSEQMKSVLEYIKDDSGINVYLKDKNYDLLKARDYAMIYTYFIGGFRNQELANVKLEDIDFEEHTIRVQAKTTKRRKERTVGMNKGVEEAIKDYLKLRQNSENESLFLTRDGKSMSSQTIGNMVKKYMSICGFKDITPHSLRRSSISYYLGEKGVSLTDVAKIVGHSSVTTTEIYDQTTSKKAQLIVAECEF